MAWNEMNLKYARNQEANEMQRNEKCTYYCSANSFDTIWKNGSTDLLV